MRFVPPCRDNSALAALVIRIDDRNLQRIHHSNGVYAQLVIVKAIIDLFQREPFEDSDCICKIDPVQLDVLPILPGILKCISWYVFTQCKYQNAGQNVPQFLPNF